MFLLFMFDTFQGLSNTLPPDGQHLMEGAKCLIDMVGIFKSEPCRLSAVAQARCVALYQRFLEVTQRFNDMLIPKRHLVRHMLERVGDFGNPEYYSNWYDEHLNKLLKKACLAVSQYSFEASLLDSMRYLLEKEAQRSA